jgi:hypothetical protein
MTDKRHAGQYPIRPSAELRSKLEAAARAGGRSLHAEIIGRLEASFQTSETVDGLSRDVLRDVIIEELENYLNNDWFQALADAVAKKDESKK